MLAELTHCKQEILYIRSGTGYAPVSSRFRLKYWIADSAGEVMKVVTKAIKTIMVKTVGESTPKS